MHQTGKLKNEAIHTKECLVKFENHSGSDDTEISSKVPCVVFVDIMVPFITSLLTNAEFVVVVFFFFPLLYKLFCY